jgi:hypothetical protein
MFGGEQFRIGGGIAGHDTADVDIFLSFVKSWADLDYPG